MSCALTTVELGFCDFLFFFEKLLCKQCREEVVAIVWSRKEEKQILVLYAISGRLVQINVHHSIKTPSLC